MRLTATLTAAASQAPQIGKENDYLTAPAVTVYSLPHCPQCKATYRLLDKAGIKYTIIDLAAEPEAFEMVRTLGYQTAPILITANGEHWAGLRPDRLLHLGEIENY